MTTTKTMKRGKREQWNDEAPEGATATIEVDDAVELRAKVDALDRVQAVIEFELDGTIVDANQNFLDAVGYRIEEIRGQHHRMFVDAATASSADYKAFWSRLNAGEFVAGEFPRVAKGGREIWIQASYNPLLDAEGRPYRVVKFATDITAQKLRNADFEGQLAAVSKAQAVIEFEMDGTILTANRNFLDAVGYRLEEIKGKHHRIFVDAAEAGGPEYRDFWRKLNDGEFQAAEYRRIGKGGREIWIQATYNPIFDAKGKPFKVVKYATDITARKAEEAETRRFVEEISDVLSRVGSQDLTVRMEGDYSGGQGQTTKNLNRALDILASALSQVAGSADEVASASVQISEGSQRLADGASSQAASIEEISASLEETSAMTSQNADNASQAKGLADAANVSAANGDSEMRQLKEAIDAIKASSDETSKIVKTIDEISFQTNMLALNAAVEAARAGDAGRGFAVVAEEVRSLAKRSADAARNTAELIEGARRNVDQGVAFTESVQKILQQISEGTSKVAGLISEIAAASKEQADGIAQITTAVDGMNAVTQENAAQSEESSAAATQLNSQVAQLKELIDQFTLETSSFRGN